MKPLARVDALCLDKTGTITQGSMKVVLTDGLGISSDEEIQYILSRMYTALDDDNSTAQAIRAYAGKGDGTCVGELYLSPVPEKPVVSSLKGKSLYYRCLSICLQSETTLVRIKNSRICQTRDACFGFSTWFDYRKCF